MITTLINLAQLTPGRVRYAISQLPPDVTAAPGVADRVADLQAAATAVVEIEKAYARSRGASRARGQAVALDNQIDRLVSAIANIAQANVAALPADDATHVASKTLLARVFPLGAAAIVTLPFEEELDAVNELLADLDTAGDLAAQAGVAHLVAPLRALAPQFATELAKRVEIVEFDAVQARRARMQRALGVVVAQLIATWPQPADEAALTAALAPLTFQMDRVRELRRRRRAVRDVNPETGEELADPTVPPTA